MSARRAVNWPVTIAVLTAACGTTYDVRTPDAGQVAAVSSRHLAVLAEPAPAREASDMVEMFSRVKGRVMPVAERFCIEETEPGTNCTYEVGIDFSRKEVNAYQSYDDDDVPRLTFTPGFLNAVGGDDELAYVMGHEAGHHIAGHLDKKETQVTAGAVGGMILGTLVLVAAAAAGVQPSDQDIANLMGGGAAVGAATGGAAYSQTYELEADMIGAYIAEAAGYDPEIGAAVFPRLANGAHAQPSDGQAAFWSTHPSSPERLAWASAVAEDIRADRAAGTVPRPPRSKSLSEQLGDSISGAFGDP